MPEKGFGVRFKRYHSTLDDFTDEKIENSVVSKRRKELKFSDIELYPGNVVRNTNPVCPECGSGDVSRNGTVLRMRTSFRGEAALETATINTYPTAQMCAYEAQRNGGVCVEV